jgi:hypothetical protein
MRRVLLAVLVIAPGVALAIAYGWGALIVYGFFAFVAFALAAGAGAVGKLSEDLGRRAGEGRFGRDRKR